MYIQMGQEYQVKLGNNVVTAKAVRDEVSLPGVVVCEINSEAQLVSRTSFIRMNTNTQRRLA